ncbi:MAG: hypothetical protein KF851_01575 [Pirellulaceae bacterium]|jgi:hypothetical protein|nr:hypothetical protein [Pirellulaceae bacterium]
MAARQRKIDFAWAFGFALIATIGCSPTSVSEAESSRQLDRVISENPEFIGEPATETAKPIAESSATTFADPISVVRDYMQLLQKEQLTESEKHLTQVAKLNFLQAKLSMQSPGGPQASVDISPPRYATNQQRIAMVECKISDRIDGKTETSDIAWMLRRDETIWRITGMVIDADDSGQKRMLSFENRDDIEFIKTNVFGDDETE